MAVLNINTLFGFTEDVEIREDGVIDEEVVEVFTSGHCHSFALALHRATGWEIVGSLWSAWDRSEFVCSPDCDHKGHGDVNLDAWPFTRDAAILVPEHVLCRDERGTLWDVTGRVRLSDCYEDAEPFVPDLVESSLCGLYRKVEPEIAAEFVPAWLEAHQ